MAGEAGAALAQRLEVRIGVQPGAAVACAPRGSAGIKGKGEMETCLLLERRNSPI